MDLTNRVDHVDEELKLLKNEIKQVLLEIQEQVLSVQNPFAGIVVATEDDRPKAKSTEVTPISASAEPESPAPAVAPPPPPAPEPPPAVVQPPAGQPTMPQPIPGPGPMPQPMPQPMPMPMPQQAPPMPQPAMPAPPQPAPMANPIAASTPPASPPVDVVALRREIEGAMEPKVEAWVRDFAKREFERLKAELGLDELRDELRQSETSSPKPEDAKKGSASVLELGEIDLDDLDLDAEPKLPPRRAGNKTSSVDSNARRERDNEPEEFEEDFDDEDEVEARRGAARPKAKRPPEEPVADIPRKPAPVDSSVVDLVTLAELAEWVGHVLANSGREYVETLLDLAQRSHRRPGRQCRRVRR